MAGAKIEIVAKPIKVFEGLKGFERPKELAPQHLYILITMSSGEQIAIRGGPAGGDDIKNWLSDDLKVTQLAFDKQHPDYHFDSIHTKHIVAKGDDAYINSILSNPNFQKTIHWISNGNFDYKLAIPVLSSGSWQNYKPHDRVIEGNKITSTSTFTYSDRREEDKKWAA